MTLPSSQGTKVLVATPVLLLGGTEIQMLSMVRVLVKNGYRVSVCCYYEYDPRIVDEFRSAGAEVELMKMNRFGGRMNVREIAALFRKLAVKFHSHRDSIVHVQYVAPGLVPLLAAKISGVRTIFATIHYPRHTLGTMQLIFVRFAARLSNVVLCNSLETERSWFGGSVLFDASANPRARHCTIFNAVDREKISLLSSAVDPKAIKKELGINGEKIIGVVGRLRSEKGHEFLFRAMAGVLQSFPSVRLLIVGDGPDKEKLKDIAVGLDIDKVIVWAGAKTQEETFSLYGIMDVVVVPSQFEGFGLTAAEAMAAGVPVVATDVGGLRDVVDRNSTGFLVPYDDARRLREAILRLLRDDTLAQKMGTEGEKKVARLFSLSTFEASMSAVYHQYSLRT